MVARMKRKQGKSPKAWATRRVLGASAQVWSLVLIDQAPLRRKAATECQRALTKLEKAKAEWKRFQQEDVATYARWTATTFGALFTRQRELEAALHAKEMLIDEVEEEMYCSGTRSYHSAYAKVMRRRERPEPPGPGEAPRDSEEEPPPGPDADENFAEDEPKIPFEQLSEAEKKRAFEDFLLNGMGVDPKRIPKSDYHLLFTIFRVKMGERDKASSSSPPPPPRSAPPPQRGRKTAPKVDDPTDARVKELYRLLVRRLHPDTRADGDAEVSAIWHEVQEAYRTKNVERLEMLLALSELQADAFGEGTSLSQMASVLKELRRSHSALQRNLKAAKQDPAWNFAHRPDRDKLERRMTRDLNALIADMERHLEALEAQLAKWAKPPGKSGKKGPSGRQMDLFG